MPGIVDNQISLGALNKDISEKTSASVTLASSEVKDGNLIIANRGTAISISLPPSPVTGDHVYFRNEGAGTLTVPGNSKTIDGNASLTLATGNSVHLAYSGATFQWGSIGVAETTSSGWTDDGGVVRLATAGDQVGVGVATLGNAANKMDIAGGIVVGATFAGTETAPTNGALFEGSVGIGPDATSPGGSHLYVREDFAGQTLVAIENYDTGADTLPRAILSLGSNTARLVGLTYGSGATGTIFGQARASSAVIETTVFQTVGRLSIGTAGSIPMYLGTADATAITIDTSQNVGVGTSTLNNKFEVSGAMVVGSTYAGTETAPTAGALFEGNVSIGTASPVASRRLTVELDDAASVVEILNTSSASQTQLYLTQTGVHVNTNCWIYMRAPTLGGDPYILWDIVGVAHNYAMGMDNSGGDYFKFTYGTDAGVTRPGDGTDLFIADGANGRIGFGDGFVPLNTVDVKGAMVIGSTFAGVVTAPTDGLVVQGDVAIGPVAFTAASLFNVREDINSSVRGIFQNETTGTGASAGVEVNSDGAAASFMAYSTTNTGTRAGLSLGDAVALETFSSAAASRLLIGSNATSTPIHFYIGLSATAPMMTINTTGKVCIGDDLTPIYELLVTKDQGAITAIAVENLSATDLTATEFTAISSTASTILRSYSGFATAVTKFGENVTDATLLEGVSNSKMLIGTEADVPIIFAQAGAKVMSITGDITLENSVNLSMGNNSNISISTTGGTQIGTTSSALMSFWGAAVTSQPTVTGSRGGNLALGSLLTALASMGLIVNSTS